jgi:hypothetical protein
MIQTGSVDCKALDKLQLDGSTVQCVLNKEWSVRVSDGGKSGVVCCSVWMGILGGWVYCMGVC